MASSLVGVEEGLYREGGGGVHLEKKEGGRESSLDTSDPREVAMVVSREMCSYLASRLEGSATKLSEKTEVRQLLEERERKGWGARCFPTPPSCLGAGGAAPQEGGSQISGHRLLRAFFWEALEVVEVLLVVLGRWRCTRAHQGSLAPGGGGAGREVAPREELQLVPGVADVQEDVAPPPHHRGGAVHRLVLLLVPPAHQLS